MMQIQKIKLAIISLLWLAGSLDAAYLTNEAYKIATKTPIFGQSEKIGFVCDINSTFSCSSVFNEKFAWIFGLPFSWIALAVYPLIFLIWILAFFWKIKNPFKYLLIIGIWGILFNSYVIINEYLIWAYCLLCLGCTAIISMVFILSLFWLKKCKKN